MEATTTLETNSWTNFSSAVDPTEPIVFATWSQAALFGSLEFTIGILGIVGNLMVFIAVSLSKSLQDTTHVFVVNLAVSDMLTALVLPFQGIAAMSETGWPYGNWMCILTGLIMFSSVPTSISTLAAIAFNRYIIITKELEVQQKIFTRRGVAIMVALLWLIPFLVLMIPQMIPATGGITYHPPTRSCTWDLEHPLVVVFQSIASAIALCCTAVTVFCYVAISVFLWKHFRAMRNNLRACTTNIESQDPPPSSGLNKKQIEVTKNLATVVIIFFICNLPLSCNLYVEHYNLRLVYYFLLVTLPVFLNPLVYALKHPTFKTVFKCMISFRYQEIPQASQSLKAALRRRNRANR